MGIDDELYVVLAEPFGEEMKLTHRHRQSGVRHRDPVPVCAEKSRWTEKRRWTKKSRCTEMREPFGEVHYTITVTSASKVQTQSSKYGHSTPSASSTYTYTAWPRFGKVIDR